MPKNNELAKVDQVAAISTLTHDTGNNDNQVIINQPTREGHQETYLTERNIHLLKSMFKDEQTYIEKMDILWIVRSLAAKACEIPGKTVKYDHTNPYFKLFILLNELIGVLLNGWVSFSFDGREMHHDINHNRRKE